MEIKKYKEVDVRNKRLLFFLIGMTISLGFVYAMMEYKQYDKVESGNLDMVYDENMVEVEQTQQKEEPPPPKEEPPQDPIIEVVEDDVKVEKKIEINTEFDEDLSFGELDMDNDEDVDEVFQWYQVQEKASFPGGDGAMDAFIKDNMEIPDIAYEEAESGTVLITFTVEKDGSLSNIHVSSRRKIGFGVEQAAITVIKKMPRWKPALQRDKPARMQFTKPIRLNFN